MRRILRRPDLGCESLPGFGPLTANNDCVTPEVGRAAEPVGVGGFEIGYVTDDGLEHRVSLSQAWATPFESCSPIRRFTSHKGRGI